MTMMMIMLMMMMIMMMKTTTVNLLGSDVLLQAILQSRAPGADSRYGHLVGDDSDRDHDDDEDIGSVGSEHCIIILLIIIITIIITIIIIMIIVIIIIVIMIISPQCCRWGRTCGRAWSTLYSCRHANNDGELNSCRHCNNYGDYDDHNEYVDDDDDQITMMMKRT